MELMEVFTPARVCFPPLLHHNGAANQNGCLLSDLGGGVMKMIGMGKEESGPKTAVQSETDGRC